MEAVLSSEISSSIYQSGHLNCVMVSVLAIVPKVCRFNPSQSDEFLRMIKVCSTPSFKAGGPILQRFYRI
jgi:hypothetical protein